MLQWVTSTHKIGLITGHFELDIPQKRQIKILRIDSILTHPIKTWWPHPNLELRDGFRIPVNQFWTTSCTTPMLQWVTSPTKLDLERDASNLTSPERSNTRQIVSILTHPIKNWLIHPNLELREGFGIPVKQFWTTWTTHEPHQCYNGPPRSSQNWI